MSLSIIVMGIPGNAVFNKLLYSFKGLFRKISIKKFWIRELSSMYGDGGDQQMTVEFTSNEEARRARTFLNNYLFVYGQMEYRLQTRMTNDGMQYNEQWNQRRRPAKRERPRSRSPGYSQEASKLDMEIELLRKQRQVIEEERRLLLEQKKLEMIREYGPSASRDFVEYDSYEPPRKRRNPQPVQRPRPITPPPPKTQYKPSKNHPKGLPLFFQPCKQLINEMKPFINKDTTPEEVEILVKLIRAAIRKKLAIALDGKGYMPTSHILKLFRERHPKENDEGFVAKILANIRASFMTEIKVENEVDEVDGKKVKEEVIVEKNDDKGSEKAEEVAKDIAVQDTTANGENVTDTTQEVTKVKSESEVSQELENVATEESTEVIAELKMNNSLLNNMVVLDDTEADDNLEGDAPRQTDYVEKQ